jgi:hypothetical protein
MANEEDLKKDFSEVYENAFKAWELWFKEAKIDLKFYLGDQWNAIDKKYLENQRRNALVFNKLRRVVKLLTGYQRKNRLSLKIDPVEGSDEITASQFSGVLQWQLQNANGYNILSDAFEQGPIKTGLNLIRLYMDYTEDPLNGDIRFRRVPFNKALLDPHFSERDFSDLNFLFFREYLTKQELKAIFPNHKKDLEQMSPKGSDQKFPYMPYAKDILGKDKFRYDEFWKKTYKEITILLDPETGAQKLWPGDKKRLGLFLGLFPNIKVLKKYVKTSELNIFVDDELFYEGPDPGGSDGFPFIPLIGFWDPEYDEMKWKLQGIIRCIRDPSTEGNKRRSKILDMIDSQIATGWAAEEDAVVNVSSLYQSGQGEPIILKKGKIYGQSLQKIPPPDIPEGLFRMMETMDKDVVDIPGANAELFGMPENEDMQIAGILSKLRQSAGLTILQDLYDNFRMSQKIMGEKMVEMVKNNYRPQKIQRIINEQPSKEFYSRDFGKYDCTPAEGVLTDTQRQMYFTQLLQLRTLGAPIPWAAIIDAAPLEQKEHLKKMVAQEEKNASEQQKAQLMMQMLTQGMMQSKIQSDIAGAEEKRTQARENQANMWLDKVKTMREISSLQNKDLMDLVSFSRMLEQSEQPQGGANIVPMQQRRRGGLTRR